jgi:poly(hydroxyalkanoate) depolymerase family esterase
MNRLGDRHTFLVAYPEQSVAANQSKCWNWFNRRDQQRDFGEPSIIAGMTHQIAQEWAVDGKRVYVAGMSAGAAASAVLATAYPDVYAALGVHSGIACGLANDVSSGLTAMNGGGEDPPPGWLRAPDCRLIPTIVFHGDRDTTVHPRNADRFAAEAVASNLEKRVETGRVPGGRSYTQCIYSDASGQRMFEQWTVHGSGHAWSGGPSGSFSDPQGPDASSEMARFFLSHEHPG